MKQLLLLVCIVYAGIVSAQNQDSTNWVYLTIRKNNAVLFIKRTHSGMEGIGKEYEFYKSWIKTTYPTYTLNGKDYTNAYRLSLYGIQCYSKKIKQIQDVIYSSEGTVLNSIKGFGGLEDVVPESIGETIVEKACALYKLKK